MDKRCKKHKWLHIGTYGPDDNKPNRWERTYSIEQCSVCSKRSKLNSWTLKRSYPY